jgi:glycosyltransferase involved in cell wall biosynthesis
VNDTHVLRVALVTLGDPATLTGGYLYHRRIASLAEANDAQVVFVPFPSWPFPAPMLAARRVAAAARDADIVLLDSIAATFAAPARLARRTPLVAMLHQPPGGIDHGPLRTRLQVPLDRLGYVGVRRYLVASEALAADAVRTGIPGTLITVLPPGCDTAPPASRRLPDMRAGRRAAVLSVGNWVERKGLLDLLDAVALLPADTATLHLVGDMGLDPAYARRVYRRLADPALTARVVVHGPLPQREVTDLYRAADIFALTSHVEPYGTVYAEAMAAGLPVVGWRAGNLPHLARDGIEGYVVEPGDSPALAAALQGLADQSQLRLRMARAAAQRAATFPTWEQTAARLFAELRSVLP